MCDNERELGRLLLRLDKNCSARDERGYNLKPRLTDIGISKVRSHCAQRMAKVPDASGRVMRQAGWLASAGGPSTRRKGGCH